MSAMAFPPWAVWLMLLGLAAFAGMIALSIRRNRGIRRTLFAFPYGLWIVVFTLIPLLLIGYYAFTDRSGAFTLDNFRTFWDSNFEMRKQMLDMGFDPADLGIARGNVNMDTLIYSLWMAFLCTLICLAMGYPAALFMADRNFKLGSTLVVLFIIPMWMNFLLRTIAWMSLLEDNGLISTLLGAWACGCGDLPGRCAGHGLLLPFGLPDYNALSSRIPSCPKPRGPGRQRRADLFSDLPSAGVISGITMFMPSVTTFFIPRVGGGNARCSATCQALPSRTTGM